jgi:hypothetical protein
MRSIILKKNLEMKGKLYLEGETVEVEDSDYKYIIDSYLESRQEDLLQASIQEDLFIKVSKKVKK